MHLGGVTRGLAHDSQYAIAALSPRAVGVRAVRAPDWVWSQWPDDMGAVRAWWLEYVSDLALVAKEARDASTRGAAEAGVRALHAMEWVVSEQVAVAHTLPGPVLEFNPGAVCNRVMFRRVMAVELPHQLPLSDSWCLDQLCALTAALSR